MQHVDIAAKKAEANKFLERIGATTDVTPLHYEPHVVQKVLESGGDFEWVPEGLLLADIRKLGTLCDLRFLNDPAFERLATVGKWTVRWTHPSEQKEANGNDKEPNITGLMMFNVMTRAPQGEHEQTRLLEVCYLSFLEVFRIGERAGRHVTVFPLHEGHPLDPKSAMPPWVMALDDKAFGGLDVRIFPVPSTAAVSGL